MKQMFNLYWPSILTHKPISRTKRQFLVTLLMSSIAISVLFSTLFGLDVIVKAAPGSIDTFNTNQAALVITSSMPIASSSVTGGGILGGARDLQVELLAANDPNTLESSVVNGSLNLEYGPGISGVTRVLWDGPGGDFSAPDFTGLGGVDLTSGNTQDAFLLGILWQDNQQAVLTVTVYSNAGDSSIITQNLGGGITSLTNLILSFNSFSVNSGAGADFSSVGAILLEIESVDAALDMQFDSFGTTGPPPREDDDEEEEVLFPSDGSSSTNPGIAAPPISTPRPNAPTVLPETGDLSVNYWPLIIASTIGLALIAGIGILAKQSK